VINADFQSGFLLGALAMTVLTALVVVLWNRRVDRQDARLRAMGRLP
jgi:hypothetical protein